MHGWPLGARSQDASLFSIDEEWLRREAPSLVFAQSTCKSCDPDADVIDEVGAGGIHSLHGCSCQQLNAAHGALLMKDGGRADAAPPGPGQPAQRHEARHRAAA